MRWPHGWTLEMTDTLAIERFAITGVGAAGGGAGDRLGAMIARVDKQRLATSLERQCASLLNSGGGVVQIRKLQVVIDRAGVSDPDAVADQLAKAIAMAIARAVRVAPTDNVVVHASSSARFASFLVALSAGTAWSGWWFENLKPLRILPLSAAIRTVLLMDSSESCAILAAIPRDNLELVLGTLAETDADAVVHAISPQCDSHGAAEQWVQVFALPCPAAPLGASQLELYALAVCAARSVAHAATEAEGVGPLPPLAAVRIWAALTRAGTPNAAALLATADPHRWRAACPELSVSDIAALTLLTVHERAMVADAAEQAGLTDVVPAHYTRFGGLILLWTCLLDEMPDALPNAPGDPYGVAALVALSTLYPDDWHADICADAVLRALFQVHARAQFADLVAYRTQHAALLQALAIAALGNFKRRLTGFAAASFAFLLDNMLDVGARVTIDHTAVKIVLDRPKLDVLLSISGIANRTIPLSDGRILTIERAP
jgi:hypothetical protein